MHEGAGADGKHDLTKCSPEDIIHVFAGIGGHILKCVKGSRKPKVTKRPQMREADRLKTGRAKEAADRWVII